MVDKTYSRDGTFREEMSNELTPDKQRNAIHDYTSWKKEVVTINKPVSKRKLGRKFETNDNAIKINNRTLRCVILIYYYARVGASSIGLCIIMHFINGRKYLL